MNTCLQGETVAQYWLCQKVHLRFSIRCDYTAAATAAKSCQSCPTLCNPIGGSPPGSPVPGILQERTLEWVAISFSNAWKWKVKVKSLSRVRLFATLWTAAHQAPLSMGFSRQEYWSGVPLPSPNFGLYFGKRMKGDKLLWIFPDGEAQCSFCHQEPRDIFSTIVSERALWMEHVLLLTCESCVKLPTALAWERCVTQLKPTWVTLKTLVEALKKESLLC